MDNHTDTDQEIRNALRFGFVDDTTASIDPYQPALVTNQKDNNVLKNWTVNCVAPSPSRWRWLSLPPVA
ncbi:hypothetical protein PQ472_00540 [Lacticaseibacillus pabuli]|uniref:Uncharacterized protein n=1 Tax=Lacticaseibacillus pabuli TaxID=3025672 RepID=A0ABY7WUD0_9LACO|nr:hypothetical protein [Lacticaseibacillus sp. KACC 23028]WDF82760.1 hypothetical protein PQ472_00540 [Lacticaseibacillus sp. KACC 23028]